MSDLEINSCQECFFEHFTANRYKFYLQAIVSLTVLSTGIYLVCDYDHVSSQFTVGVSLISAILGYWVPNPKFKSSRQLQQKGKLPENQQSISSNEEINNTQILDPVDEEEV